MKSNQHHYTKAAALLLLLSSTAMCAAACGSDSGAVAPAPTTAPAIEAAWNPNAVPQPRRGAPVPSSPANEAIRSAPEETDADPAPLNDAASLHAPKPAPRLLLPPAPQDAPAPNPADAPQPGPEPGPAPGPAYSGNGEHLVPNLAPADLLPPPLPKAEDIYIPLPNPHQPLPRAEDIRIPVPR